MYTFGKSFGVRWWLKAFFFLIKYVRIRKETIWSILSKKKNAGVCRWREASICFEEVFHERKDRGSSLKSFVFLCFDECKNSPKLGYFQENLDADCRLQTNILPKPPRGSVEAKEDQSPSILGNEILNENLSTVSSKHFYFVNGLPAKICLFVVNMMCCSRKITEIFWNSLNA